MKVTNLMLDAENPRIPPPLKGRSQDDLLAVLIEHDLIHELAKRIATNGYYADELLIVTPHNGRFLVLEGNRRVAALKALLSPAAVPEQHRRKFIKLSKGIQTNAIRKVGVLVAPTREAALPRIAEKHTRSMLQAWKTPQQARFYKRLVAEGKDPDRICADFGLTPGGLDDFLRLGTLYEMACSIGLEAAVQSQVENPRKFPLTNLERFVESTLGQEFLGLVPDKKHFFKGIVELAEFRKGFAKVVTDTVRGKEGGINSRTIHDKEAIKRYLKGIQAFKPDKSKKGRFTPTDVVGKVTVATPGGSSPGKTKRKRRTTASLIPSDLKCLISDTRINSVFRELKKLKVGESPNGSALLLRVLLELSVSNYIGQNKRNKDLLSKVDRKGKKPTDWYPSLRQQIQFVIGEMHPPLDPLELKALGSFVRKGSNDAMVLDTLDGYVHSYRMIPTEPELRSIFVKIDPLLRLVLSPL